MIGFLSVIAGYILGSIPTGYLAGRWLAGIDLRELGSGSTGATNVFRQMDKKTALLVFLIDVSKGTASILLAKVLLCNQEYLVDWFVITTGLAALAGHVWPIWLGGKGGKAVATSLGVLLGLSWMVGLICFIVFFGYLILSRTVSLSSVLTAIGLPLLVLKQYASGSSNMKPAYILLAIFASYMVIWRHRGNIARIAEGVEPRFQASKK
uniref:Uncharacterized protein n=1 Tax=Paulinella chromatophora TaxID=39717 RepID=B1X3J2_PAUCH|nr:hypothetical protein PCC_0052 [Paulinella chromatophora]ACB42511.1 hypothetical protein PCC_0052 [Paulinella chromatophora]